MMKKQNDMHFVLTTLMEKKKMHTITEEEIRLKRPQG